MAKKSSETELPRDREVIEVVEEVAHVSKRVVDRGGVTISKVVSEHEEVIPTSSVVDEIEIERIPRNEWLDRPATTRTEGDTTIIPVMEEVVVTEKRLLLKEEVHIRRVTKTVTGEEKVALRKESVQIDDTRERTRKK